MAVSVPLLEEIRLKRMVVTDESLELIAKSFKNFKVLVLISCEGFSTEGLEAIASDCRFFFLFFHSFFLFVILCLVGYVCIELD
jgi:hypothetical protein